VFVFTSCNANMQEFLFYLLVSKFLFRIDRYTEKIVGKNRLFYHSSIGIIIVNLIQKATSNTIILFFERRDKVFMKEGLVLIDN